MCGAICQNEGAKSTRAKGYGCFGFTKSTGAQVLLPLWVVLMHGSMEPA